MRPCIHRPETLASDVRVDLCRSHIGVSEQFLNSSEICASLEQVGGEGVPERVGVQDPPVGQWVAGQDPADVPGSHPPATSVHEESLPYRVR